MTNTIAKLLLSVLSLVLCALIYTVIVVLLMEMRGGPSDVGTFIFAGIVTLALSIATWWLIWARRVVWNRRRVITLFAVVFGAVLVGVIAALLIAIPLNSYMADFATFAGSVFATLLALAGFILTIRETPLERTARLRGVGVTRVHCPACNYDMTGLHTSDCPECGGKFTIEEFIARLREQQSAPTIDDADSKPGTSSFS